MRKFRILGPGERDQEIVATLEAHGIADEYHTMHELYEHRMALTIALTKQIRVNGVNSVWRSKLHSDGLPCFDGTYFVVGINKQGGQQISYHYDLKHWDKFSHCPELERAPVWDMHNSHDAIQRLMEL